MVSVHIINERGHITVWIPKDDKWPDASRAATLQGRLDSHGTLRIGSIRTTSLFQRQGYGTILLDYIKTKIPSVRKITASVDVGAEEFYIKNGFKQIKSSQEFIWPDY